MNILKTLELNFENDDISENNINRFIEFLKSYPVDLMVGIMKDIKSNYINVYNKAIENEEFVELYFESYSMIGDNLWKVILINKQNAFTTKQKK